ncbi:hypothetical protein NIES2109_64000 (plasmid) [Nostoc sp. HK-01]|nr:hypothetical protein NIES2109_63080 [Nostoc sp. HK-01]BBD63525.1 hypothetical protein NIES2109_64000 [Nostoc sp. HK-01]
MVALIAQSPILTSPWQVPIPQKEYVNDRVVIYYRDNSWVPIKYCYLLKAIELHYRIWNQSGKEVFVFPTDLDPNSFS